MQLREQTFDSIFWCLKTPQVYADVKELMNFLNNRDTFLSRRTGIHIFKFYIYAYSHILFQLTFVGEKLLLMSKELEDISS